MSLVQWILIVVHCTAKPHCVIPRELYQGSRPMPTVPCCMEVIMHRRDFMLKTAASFAAAGLTLSGCTTTGKTKDPAQRKQEIDSGVDSTLSRLYSNAQGSQDLVNKAQGVLVFPSVLQAGFIVGGQHGDGALRMQSQTVGYYTLTSGSAGLQVGAQSKAVIFLFMTKDALTQLRNSNGWTADIDASVSVMRVGSNGVVDLTQANSPVLAFILTNAGLMANLSVQGSKISPLKL